MKTVTFPIPKLTIQQFGGIHGLIMEIHTREDEPQGSPVRFYAHFQRAETLDRGILAGMYGNGASPKKAIRDYAHKISQKLLVINSYSRNRREIVVPELL